MNLPLKILFLKLASYINLHYPEVWSLAIIQLCIRGGIYAIINLKNNMIYIGKATIGNLHIRLKSHLIRISSNNSLYADVIKDGIESFIKKKECSNWWYYYFMS